MTGEEECEDQRDRRLEGQKTGGESDRDRGT